jgi:hypothetical protein
MSHEKTHVIQPLSRNDFNRPAADDKAKNTSAGRKYTGRKENGLRVLSDEELVHMRQFGFLAIEQVTSQPEVLKIRAVLENLFHTKAGHKEGAHFNFAGPEDDPNAPSIPQIIAPHNYAKSLRKTQFYHSAFAMARQILGPDVRFGSDHTLMKPAINGPATPWHQDEAFRDPDYDYNEISIWMPLQPVNQVNGCMEFIPGSHLQEILPHRSPNNDPRIHVLECYEGFDVADAISCALPPGGCTIHTGRTLHGAGPNRSDQPRFAYVLTFATPPVPAKQPRAFPWLKDKDTARLRRMKKWLRSGGLVVETWRMLKRTELRDYGKVLPRLTRKARLVLTLMQQRKADDPPDKRNR